MPSLLLLGSTGSIGKQTLELVRASPARHRVVGLAAQRSWPLVLEQAREFGARFVALTDPEAALAIRAELPPSVHVFSGPDAHVEIARVCDYDVAVHGVVGAAGLRTSVAVLERGKKLALANKESLVLAGGHLMRIAREHGAEVIPVDSEHSAVFQCLRGEDLGRVRRILLTASGGPFRAASLAEIECATPALALKHPNWNMGPRITIGSATLMNKALEVIELHHLFDLEAERIAVVIHPQSIVHSLVEFVDGSVMAQMGPPDMRGPIHYALHHPERVENTLTGFDFTAFAKLSFEAPDRTRFPALELGWRCIEEGGDAGAVLNAADEIAVEAFLAGRIPFPEIARLDARVLDRRTGRGETIEDLLRSDERAREMARSEIAALGSERAPSPR